MGIIGKEIGEKIKKSLKSKRLIIKIKKSILTKILFF